jgi:hypothetical protein
MGHIQVFMLYSFIRLFIRLFVPFGSVTVGSIEFLASIPAIPDDIQYYGTFYLQREKAEKMDASA